MSEGRVLSIAGGRYRVWTEAGDQLEASLPGKLKRGQRVIVGDRVIVNDDAGNVIDRALERTSVLKRRTPGRRRGVRTVAANVDQVVVVGSADHPTWDPRLIDRFIAIAMASEIPVVVVINKADLVAETARLAAPYVAAEFTVLVVSVKTGRGIDELATAFAGKTSLLTGTTGVGKSSLANAIQPGLKLRTGELSHKTHTGRHTTVTAEMFPLDRGGFVVDTPGLRDIGLWGVDRSDVLAAFPEFDQFSAQCRFDDCRHLAEPDCAVQQARQNGQLSKTRWVSYKRLLEEAEQAARHWE